MVAARIDLPKVSMESLASGARADYRFAPFNVLLLVTLMLAGMVAHVVAYEFSVEAVVFTIGAALVLAGIFRVTQVWEGVIVAGAIVALGGYLVLRSLRIPTSILVATTIAGSLLAPCIQIAYQWERAVLLRFGKFVAFGDPASL